jgi:2-oxo-4-hydroxy-4-carboxy-5-ureidoimidazoline decarboxylase
MVQLLSCCGASAWAKAMFERQPFADIHAEADDVWWSLTEEDWLEAFSAHPKIGQRSAVKWTATEQSGMSQADAETANEMARLNADYEDKFGFIFIICASGKSGGEMLKALQTRITNTRDEEIRIAAGEQARITHLRLDKLAEE